MKHESCLDFERKSMETDRTTRSLFPNGGKVIVEQTLGSEERKKIQKNRTVRVTVRNPSRKVKVT